MTYYLTLSKRLNTLGLNVLDCKMSLLRAKEDNTR